MISQSINGGGALSVTPKDVTLDQTGKIVTLSVSTVTATTSPQSIVYSVSCKGTSTAYYASFIVSPVAAPAAPSVTADDAANVIVGADATMEYSTDNGSTYTAYDVATPPTFTGDQTVLVRVAANSTTGAPASADTTLTFTTP
ncbi:DUF4073 domain-containing protein [Desulfosporosinus sp. PR]|uniref:DUF4073 domain-containing protein n=1 Tax=Candidatus Desulfosporosinus nitrosoreducens TaxID=3401928 RepID=UPI0027FC15F8|nr:DUF4073 domain-containing protein [Desulfosporosinus sp. PR]MDQ7093932.1 DUF4073 domain-containing protein [Desulfosporosinus sp. PR]